MQLGFLKILILASRLSFLAFIPAALLPSREKFTFNLLLCLIPPLRVLFFMPFCFNFLPLPCLVAKDLEPELDWGSTTGLSSSTDADSDFPGSVVFLSSDLKKNDIDQPCLDVYTCICFLYMPPLSDT